MKVELLDYFGDDNMIVDAARVSFNKEASNYTIEQNDKLIKYLVEHKHTAPFRHPHLQFRISCPIYVERQLFKHVQGITVNSLSGRYVDFSDTYTEIKQFRKQSKNSKQGSAEDLDSYTNGYCKGIQANVIDFCQKAYGQMLDLGVSKEQARTILPLNLNTTFIWTGSLQAFLHLCDLRLKPDAQFETREVVAEMLEKVKLVEVFDKSIKAWLKD